MRTVHMADFIRFTVCVEGWPDSWGSSVCDTPGYARPLLGFIRDTDQEEANALFILPKGRMSATAGLCKVL